VRSIRFFVNVSCRKYLCGCNRTCFNSSLLLYYYICLLYNWSIVLIFVNIFNEWINQSASPTTDSNSTNWASVHVGPQFRVVHHSAFFNSAFFLCYKEYFDFLIFWEIMKFSVCFLQILLHCFVYVVKYWSDNATDANKLSAISNVSVTNANSRIAHRYTGTVLVTRTFFQKTF